MKSLRAKLTAGILILSIIGMVSVSVVNYLLARNTILKQSIQSNVNFADFEAGVLSNWTEKQLLILDSVANAIVANGDREKIQDILTTQLKNSEYMLDIYVGFTDGYDVYGSKWNMGEDYDPNYILSERGWYNETLDLPKGVYRIGDPYADIFDNYLAISPSKYGGQVDGVDFVIVADIKIDSLHDLLEKAQNESDNYLFVVDSNQNIVSHSIKAFEPPVEKWEKEQAEWQKRQEEWSKNNTGEFPEAENVQQWPRLKDIKSLKDPKENEPTVYESIWTQFHNSDAKYIKIVDYDGVSRYFIKSHMPAFNWDLYVAIPQETIVAPASSLLYSLIPLLIVMMVICIIFTGFLIKKLITKPIADLNLATKRIAKGDINIKLATNQDDEIGELNRNFQTVISTLQDLIFGLSKMSQDQQLGEIDSRIDTSHYQGAYSELASGINEMMANTNGVFLSILKCVDGFSHGDFKVPFAQLPGKQLALTVAVEGLRTNLTNINLEIGHLIQGASSGELSVRANETLFKGDWAKLISSLNSFMDVLITPVKELSETLEQVSKGDLSAKMVGNYSGDFAKIQLVMNTTTQELSSYVFEISDILSHIANGNLENQITRDYLGDFIKIKDSINHIVGTWNDIIIKILDLTTQVNKGAQNASDSSMQIASCSLNQTNSINKLSELINTVSMQSEQNASIADEAEQLSIKTTKKADDGKADMEKLMNAILNIKESSNNISKIMKVIEDIAFQTNLLALNAAVESARAGVHGKGFAVVAEEVRNLAGRSQIASKETQVLIDDSTSRVAEGITIAVETSQTLGSIIGDISEVSRLISSISQASKEQADTLVQISTNINDVSETVQNNSATSEESSASTQELANQSVMLNNIMQTTFNIRKL